MFAIHGTNYNEAFESVGDFLKTHSRGCVRVYDDAVDDLRNLIEQSAQNLRKIEADYRNPTNDAYVLGRTIPVTFKNYFPQIRGLL
ncbi:MAG: L,D-transpeptidase [Candidatus Nanoarchaeia archaeon]